MDINGILKEIEVMTGKIIASCRVVGGNITNIEFMPYGLGDLVLDVWNMKIRLCRVVPTEGGGYAFIELLSGESCSPEAAEWLEQALDACGGFINRSGHYPLVVPVPEWLEPEITIAALGR